MKRLFTIICVMTCTGCASTDALDEIGKLRAELTEKIERSDEKLKKELKSDVAQTQQTLQADVDKKFSELKKTLAEQREAHQKETKELNLTLIDVQKDFFQNRRVTEDSARRVYILESLIAARRAMPEEKAEGEVLSVKEDGVTTNLGARHGIKAGDVVGVYRDYQSKEKLASIRIMVAATDESTGEIVEKTSAVVRGNVVRPIK